MCVTPGDGQIYSDNHALLYEVDDDKYEKRFLCHFHGSPLDADISIELWVDHSPRIHWECWSERNWLQLESTVRLGRKIFWSLGCYLNAMSGGGKRRSWTIVRKMTSQCKSTLDSGSCLIMKYILWQSWAWSAGLKLSS